jgi:hypothetical protein
MKNTLTTLLLLLSFVSFSQKLSYKVIKDEPNKIKKFTVHLDPFFVDAWSTNSTLGFGARADLMFLKRFSGNLTFRKAYLDMNARTHADASLAKPKNGFSKMTYIEPSVAFHLRDRLKKRDVKVVLSSNTTYSGNYQTTHTKYIMVPGTVRRITAARGGLFFVNTAIDMDEGDAIKTWTATNGNEKVSFGDFGTTIHGSSVYNGYTQMRQVTLFGGLSFKSITNLKAEVEGYSKPRGNYNFYDFYVDYMFAPVLNFQDVKFADGTKFTLSNSTTKRTGWRVGMLWKNANRAYLSYGFEFGQRPGYEGNDKGFLNSRSFLNLVMGVSIPYDLKILK